MNIYTPEGWLDVRGIRKACPKAFMFVIVGARRTGKTYGILDLFHELQEPYIFMRLTKEELDYTISHKVNMYRENGFSWAENMTVGEGKPLYIYDSEFEEGNLPVAMALALSDVAKIRGYGAKRYKRIFLDEFIPETTAFSRKGLGVALKNAYMTINSTRELEGEAPVELWLSANSNNLNNDILSEFNLTPRLLLMQKREQEFCYIPERGLCLIMIDKSPVSDRLSRTALFNCIGTNDDFSKMAINNIFVNDDSTGVQSRPIREYKLQFIVDGIGFYKHKSRNEWYIAEGVTPVKGIDNYNSKNPTHATAYKRYWSYFGLITPVDGETIFYNTYIAKLTFYKLFNIK